MTYQKFYNSSLNDQIEYLIDELGYQTIYSYDEAKQRAKDYIDYNCLVKAIAIIESLLDSDYEDHFDTEWERIEDIYSVYEPTEDEPEYSDFDEFECSECGSVCCKDNSTGIDELDENGNYKNNYHRFTDPETGKTLEMCTHCYIKWKAEHEKKEEPVEEKVEEPKQPEMEKTIYFYVVKALLREIPLDALNRALISVGSILSNTEATELILSDSTTSNEDKLVTLSTLKSDRDERPAFIPVLNGEGKVGFRCTDEVELAMEYLEKDDKLYDEMLARNKEEDELSDMEEEAE